MDAIKNIDQEMGHQPPYATQNNYNTNKNTDMDFDKYFNPELHKDFINQVLYTQAIVNLIILYIKSFEKEFTKFLRDADSLKKMIKILNAKLKVFQVN